MTTNEVTRQRNLKAFRFGDYRGGRQFEVVAVDFNEAIAATRSIPHAALGFHPIYAGTSMSLPGVKAHALRLNGAAEILNGRI